jgi:hypothetical protein
MIGSRFNLRYNALIKHLIKAERALPLETSTCGNIGSGVFSSERFGSV